jgi:DNA transformation protein and related proteins
MAVSESYLAYVAEQLSGIGRLSSKRMFGGVGFYADGVFFGLLAAGGLYLKVDDSNRGDFVARGMGPFRPYSNRPELSMSYYEVPADIIEDAEALVEWARRASRVASASPPKAKSRRAGPPAANSPKRKSRGAKGPMPGRRKPGDF